MHAEIKGAPKLYFMHYSCVVTILLTADLYKSVFSAYTFKKLVFRLFVFYVFWIQCHLSILEHLCSYCLYRYKVLFNFVLTYVNVNIVTRVTAT